MQRQRDQRGERPDVYRMERPKMSDRSFFTNRSKSRNRHLFCIRHFGKAEQKNGQISSQKMGTQTQKVCKKKFQSYHQRTLWSSRSVTPNAPARKRASPSAGSKTF